MTKTISQPREHAADAFNAGKVRFPVSKVAGGEGIDLQERCAELVHVDMPWIPMRLHKRVGRLSRYGQKRPVSVHILRNPQTVEARIWDLLNERLERIQLAVSSVMEEQEDISQLVIGMAGNSLFNELFSVGQGVSNERLGHSLIRRRHLRLGQRSPDRLALHRTGQAYAERLRRELQRQDAG
ncbi:MAG: hypothetical protein KDK75_01925 [Alphaproteobacteria bacterium]|nr:hypothetical protein [Alphaproteobacteria bacterium]